MMRLRPFSPTDISDVMKIVGSSMQEKYPASMFLELHNIWREGFFICEYFGSTVGLIVGTLSGFRTARILVIAVLEPHRCKGIGTALLNEFTNACGMKGLSNIELEVRKSNKGAIKFYEKHGYQVIDIIPHFYNDGEDGFKMLRNL
ncbi:MAG: GNAT family N-acetyltransferase [Methanobacteriota archaeon]|nr:MAG: GNAT family N-acetyltransferase [Euryarchaeota archaeon]